MKKFNRPSVQLLKALWLYSHRFQGIVAFIANKTLGSQTTPIYAADVYEGGVTVNIHWISIKSDHCIDEYRLGSTYSIIPPSPEEEATAQAIESVLSKLTPDTILPGLIRAQEEAGLTNEDLYMFLQQAPFIYPLRSFFQDINPKKEDQTTKMDKGPWKVTTFTNKHKKVDCYLESADFTHDVTLTIHGDFADYRQKKRYASELAEKLNKPVETNTKGG